MVKMTWQQKYNLIREDYRNIWYYNQGMVRMWLFNNMNLLIRPHIQEQFWYRKSAAKRCTDNGSCLVCSCKTPELYMADKPCALSKATKDNRMILMQQEEPCYGRMMNRKEWDNFKSNLVK